MPHPTSTFHINDALDQLVVMEGLLNEALFVPNIPEERILATAIAGSILITRCKQLPCNMFSPLEQLFVEGIEDQLVDILKQYGQSANNESGTPTQDTPVDNETRPYPEEDYSGPFPPETESGTPDEDTLPYDPDEDGAEDRWNEDSNWGCW